MMDERKALKIIRDKFKGYYVVRYFKFLDLYVFYILMKNTEQTYTNQGIDVCVNKNGDVVNFDMGLITKYPDEFIRSERKAIYVDKVD